MATLPSATTRLSDQSSSAPTSTDLCCVVAPVTTIVDGVPRLYSSVAALIAAHGYSQAAEYAALHMQDAAKPILLCPIPIVVAGVIKRQATSHTGSCVVSVAATGVGCLDDVDAILKVVAGGTTGTSEIMLSLSLDGGLSYKPVRLGTALSYVVPNIGATISFSSAGTLVAGETCLEFTTSAPLPDATGIALAKTKLVAQQLLPRSILFVGDMPSGTLPVAVETAINAYETAAERYALAKVQMRDRLPLALNSQVRVRMLADPSVTFAEVGGTGDTITRATGSFLADGFCAGDTIRVTGSTSNNVTGVPTNFGALVLTLGATDLADEGPKTGITITSEPTLTFGDNGGSPDTLTRNRGSWINEGFRQGDSITITGTASNNVTKTITAITNLIISVATGSFAAEIIGSYGVVVATGESDAVWAAAIAAMVSAITATPKIDLGAGRLTKLSPISGYTMRRPVQWADSIRSYQHDIKTTTWQKDLGLLTGWGIAGEHDERVDGGLLANRFTCARTWGNGPEGAFIAMSMTRADDGSMIGLTHNSFVANLAQTICQRETEACIGQVLVLKPADSLGKRFAKQSSLAVIEAKVNSALNRELLSNIGGEGQRSSVAKWTAATDDDLGVADATIHGTCDLELNGTVVHISTVVAVR